MADRPRLALGLTVCLCLLQTLFAIPALLVFWHDIGLPFFVVTVVILLCAAIFFLCDDRIGARVDWTCILMLRLLFIFPVALLELAVFGWTFDFLSRFITPFSSNGGWNENCPQRVAYSGFWLQPSCDFLKGWYAAGIALSLLLLLVPFVFAGVLFIGDWFGWVDEAPEEDDTEEEESEPLTQAEKGSVDVRKAA